MTQPTHDEVIAFLNSQETNFKWLISNPHGNYVDYEIQSFKVGLAQTLANRDVLEEKPLETYERMTEKDVGYLNGYNMSLAILQRKILQRIAEVM